MIERCYIMVQWRMNVWTTLKRQPHAPSYTFLYCWVSQRAVWGQKCDRGNSYQSWRLLLLTWRSTNLLSSPLARNNHDKHKNECHRSKAFKNSYPLRTPNANFSRQKNGFREVESEGGDDKGEGKHDTKDNKTRRPGSSYFQMVSNSTNEH